MAQHHRLKIDAGLQVYFCDPQSQWQRGTNENTNGLLRQYFPKGGRHATSDVQIFGKGTVRAVSLVE